MAPTMAVPADLMTIEAAMRAFDLGRSTIFRAFASGKLTRYEGGLGDAKVYVSRRELEELIKPRREQKR